MTNVENLSLLRNSAIDEIARMLDLAASPKQYIDAVRTSVADKGKLLLLPWTFGSGEPQPTFSRVGAARLLTGQDIENAISVFEYLGDMTPVAASDQRLWTHLAHTTFLNYQLERWPLDGEKWKSRVADRWLMRNSSRGALVRNGVSRLWWAAKLTVDDQKIRNLSGDSGDKWAYLRVLLAHEDAFLGIVDRDIGMIPNLLFAVLDHIASDSENGQEAYVRALMKEIVLVAGYSEWAGLSSRETEQSLAQVVIRVRST